MAAEIHYLYIDSDNLITLSGARRTDTGAYLNAASATWVLYPTEADALAETNPLANGTLAYVASSNGVYRGTIESADVTLVKGTVYFLKVSASEAGADDTRILRCVAKYHGASP